jgi:epidermal growth factor receptor substrate 15
LAFQPAPLPKFEGGLPAGISPTIQPPPGPPPSALQPQGSGSGPIRVPPLTPEKATQYAALFEKSGAVNGQLPGEQAKQIFERANLPNEVLGRIWTLADTEQRGTLQATEFVIAMHLLASFKGGQLRALPNVLPAGLYEAAARRAPSRQSTGSLPAIPRQFSGNPAQRAGSPLSRSFPPPPPPPPPQVQQYSGFAGGNGWAISPSDKVKFDSIYMGLDKTNKGFITGEEAVPFFSESKLPEEVLAQIWDLSDIRSAGVLTRDEFAVAMYLIRQQRGKRDDRDSLPATLPQNLVPPSMRNQTRPPDVPTAPAFDAAPTLPKSAAEDLFGLDALASPSSASPPAPIQPLSTGGSGAFDLANDPFGNSKTMTPTSPAHPPSGLGSSSVFKPFAPSSSFGQSLNQQATGGSNSAPMQRGFQPQRSATEDLLGDNDPEESKKFTNESAELGNLSNQVSSLSSKMQEVQAHKVNTQNELSQSSAQKQQFEQRLAQLRALYEQEAQSVKSLQEKLTASRNETKDLQTKIAMIEGSYQDLQNQHRQTAAALQADQQENASLKEKMRAMNAEITQMKPTLEKLRSDARQQKGLVAINKKQLATNEAEREKMKAEAQELNRSIQEDTKTLAEQARAQSPPHIASPVQVASPAPSSMSANNPFFRRQGSTSDIPSPPLASPTHQTDRSFENVFGPAFGGAVGSPALGGPPPTSFGHGIDTPSVPNILSRAPTGHGEFSSPMASSPATSHRELPTAQSAIPPPPESREISSSFLPFPSHEDSVTSSRQVSAPNSRFGEDSTGADTPTNYLGNTPTGSSSAGPSEIVRAASPNVDRNSTASPASTGIDAMPGAFPDTGVVATPTGGSTLSEKAASDPFAINQDPARSVASKDDFDSAFAGFGGPAKPQERMNTGSSAGGSNGGPPPVFNKEFPPIAELDNDDDSDSASETAGFDDDFSPASPGHTRQISSSQSFSTAKVVPIEEPNDFLSARPLPVQNASALSLGTLPPTPGAQVSPPAYDKTISPSETAHSEVQNFSGLLPTREIPTSPPLAAPANAPSSTFMTPAVSAQPVPPPKVSFGDDFDEFDDLEDAKEGDADDEFANTSTDRSGLDDFNPMFDSPPQSKGADHAPQNGFSNENMFGDFTASPQTTQPKPSAPVPATNAVNDNQDWDAIFAGLDGPTTRDSSPPKADAPTSNGAALAPERPQIGRALTEAGVHDDPILKNLTGMGYARNEALAALEKYDYNLERVSSWLEKNATQH